MTPTVKYLGKQDKTVITFYLKYDDILDGYTLHQGNPDYTPIMTGSQKAGTQLIKVYKSVDSAKRAFNKSYAKYNDSPYVNIFNSLVII